MLCRQSRLRGRAAFVRFARARHYHGVLLRVAFVPGDGLKCAFAVGRKVSPRAVVRNRLKRRLRELFRKWHDLLPQNTWLLVIALPEAAHADFAALDADFEKICGGVASKKSRNNLD